MVVVEVDVDRVVHAGRRGVGDEVRDALAVEGEQVIVRVVADPYVAGLREARRELVGVLLLGVRQYKFRDGPRRVELDGSG